MKKITLIIVALLVTGVAMAAGGNGILKKLSYNKYDGTELIQFLLGTGNVDTADLSFKKNETILIYQNWIATRFPGEDFRTVVSGSVEEDIEGFDFAASNMGFVTANKKIEWFHRQPYQGERVLVYKGIVWASTWCWNPIDAEKTSKIAIAPRKKVFRQQESDEEEVYEKPRKRRPAPAEEDEYEPRVRYGNNSAPAPQKSNFLETALAVAVGSGIGSFGGTYFANMLSPRNTQYVDNNYYQQNYTNNYNYRSVGGMNRTVFPRDRIIIPRGGGTGGGGPFSGGNQGGSGGNGGGNGWGNGNGGYSNTWPR